MFKHFTLIELLIGFAILLICAGASVVARGDSTATATSASVVIVQQAAAPHLVWHKDTHYNGEFYEVMGLCKRTVPQDSINQCMFGHGWQLRQEP
jgi:hypothetical protein